jgi:hypothetical protein
MCGSSDGKDPTRDPAFQRVVRSFLESPPKPHKPARKRKAAQASRKRKQRKANG